VSVVELVFVVAGVVAVLSVVQAAVVVTRTLLVDPGTHGGLVSRTVVTHRPIVVPELVAARHRVHTDLATPASAAARLYPALVELAERAPVAVRIDPPPGRAEPLGRWLDAQLGRLEAAYSPPGP
jgi:hypothetical protein